MSPTQKRLLSIVISLPIMIALLLWAGERINFKTVVNDFSRISDVPFLIVGLIYSIILFLYGLRFKYLSQLSLGASISVAAVGNGLNSLLPFRLGEVGRVYYAKQVCEFPVPSMLVVTLLERYIDMVAILLMAGVVFFSSYGEHLSRPTFEILIACLLGMFGLFIALSRSEAVHVKLKSYFGVASYNAVAEILKRFKSARFSGKIGLITFLIWLSTLISYCAFFKFLNQPNTIGFEGALFLLVMTTLSMLVPSLVANIGVFESVIVLFLLKFAHIDVNESLAIAAMLHLANLVPQVIGMGICVLWSRCFSGRKK